MNALLTAIVIWLAANFDLPANYDHPRVEHMAPVRMAALRYRGLMSDRSPVPAPRNDAQRLDRGSDVVALYDPKRKVIFLPDGWTGRTAAELSVVVHEMVHHLQNQAGLKFDCPGAQEKMAYAAQAQWLALFGKTLGEEFEIDALSLLVRTNCLD
jgi:hypothetical protein